MWIICIRCPRKTFLFPLIRCDMSKIKEQKPMLFIGQHVPFYGTKERVFGHCRMEIYELGKKQLKITNKPTQHAALPIFLNKKMSRNASLIRISKSCRRWITDNSFAVTISRPLFRYSSNFHAKFTNHS